MSELRYQTGFRNEFATEALPGALPVGRNSPQKPAYGLYPEQFTGSAFTEPRGQNLRSWLYRIRPSVLQGDFRAIDRGLIRHGPLDEGAPPPPNQYRWDPLPDPAAGTDFLKGLVTVAVNGSLMSRQGSAIHLYACNADMSDRYFYNSDGDFLIVAQEGTLLLRTEQGDLTVSPHEIAVLQRGLKFQVLLSKGDQGKVCRGYICENYGAPFVLPGLGPIGANGLALPRDFETPVASYEDRTGDFKLVTKFGGHLYEAALQHSPLDVVAWHGNYAPFRYDLRRFNTINTVSFDHPDPSIFTVLTSPTTAPGIANIDFVIFPPRWMVAEDTFRPPYYHRNIMSEYMGLIHGVYDAKTGGGFVPGGGSLHNCMSSHGPDGDTVLKAMEADLKPEYQGDTLAFMFESCLMYHPTNYALEAEFRQRDYMKCWQSVPYLFDPKGGPGPQA